MTTQPEPEPQERDAPPERRVEEDEMRYPRHGDPEDVREDVGLEKPRDPEPEGAPVPPAADRSRRATTQGDEE
jgi:hypothetical protein